MKTHMDKYFRSAHWNTYPYVELEGVKWLIEKQISVLGTDAAKIHNGIKNIGKILGEGSFPTISWAKSTLDIRAQPMMCMYFTSSSPSRLSGGYPPL